MNFRIVPIALLALAASCAPSKKKSQVQYLEDPPPEFKTVGGIADANDVALFLAGKPVRHGERLSRLQQTAQYQDHQLEMRGVWKQLASRRVGRMSTWSWENVAPYKVVNYPFGGPDLLYASAMFPRASQYNLMGLEKAGEVPALESLPPEEVLGALPAYRRATKTQLRVGYFITEDMKSDLDRSALRGVTPIMLGSIALMGGEVRSVSGTSVGGYQGLEIRYQDENGNHNATYISGDLSNGGFNDSYQQWLAAQGRGVTYFKAASYLMHDDRFSKARNFFLSNSSAIVQDDSGIPIRYFDTNQWNIRYFGNYEAPIALFARHAQADLKAAYDSNPSSPLNFGSGYHYDPADANLILAVKR